MPGERASNTCEYQSPTSSYGVLAVINQPAPFPYVRFVRVPARTGVIIYGRSLAWQQFRNVSSPTPSGLCVAPLDPRVIAIAARGNHR